MYLIRDVMFCKPGMVKPMVEKFKTLGKVLKKQGFKGKIQILTDLSSERYWTAIWEMEVESIDNMNEMMKKASSDPQMANVMKDYHELIVSGRREIYRVEK